MPQILQVVALAAATFGTGAATLSVMNEDVPDLEVPAGDWVSSGALDGMRFNVIGRDLDSGAELTDDILFRNGTFQSEDCQNYCDFGWSEYQTKEVDGVLHFTSTTICSEAPHTVVWYGRVEGDQLTLDMTWTTRRWYWTNQIRGTASGTLVTSEEATG